MKIKDLPESELPRERLLRYGAKNLSNEDLLSILLRTGTKNRNVKVISMEVLTKIKMIEDLNDLRIKDFTSIKGLGEVKAITLMAAIELGKRVANKTITNQLLINNTEKVHQFFSQLIGSSEQEQLLVILLDNKKRLINYQIMYIGTSRGTSLSPKEIFNYAIKEKAAGVIIMHNHPSGNLNPSKEDIATTNKLIETGIIVDIPLLDHLITDGKNYYSFFDEMVVNEN